MYVHRVAITTAILLNAFRNPARCEIKHDMTCIEQLRHSTTRRVQDLRISPAPGALGLASPEPVASSDHLDPVYHLLTPGQFYLSKTVRPAVTEPGVGTLTV